MGIAFFSFLKKICIFIGIILLLSIGDVRDYSKINGNVISIEYEKRKYVDIEGINTEIIDEVIDFWSIEYSNGKVIREVFPSDGKKPRERMEYIYDPKGMLIGAKKYEYDSGMLICNIEYKYDSKRTKTIETNEDGEIIGMQIEYFNEIGKIEKKEIYNKDGTILMYTLYAYDYVKNFSAEKYHNALGIFTNGKIQYYDELGRVIKEGSIGKSGSTDSSEEYGYNLNGNIEKRSSTVYLSFGPVTFGYGYLYEYDSSGNWTKKIECDLISKFGEIEYDPIYVTTRKIKYK